MPIDSIVNYDVLNRGLFRIAFKDSLTEPAYDFFRNVLFGGQSQGTADDFLAIDYRKLNIALSEEAIRNADPRRVNYQSGFNEKMIFGQYYFDEDKVDVTLAENRIWNEPIDRPFSVEQRLLYIVADKRDALRRSQLMSLEKLCADTALNGKFVTKAHGEQTFPMSTANLNVSAATLLTDPVGVLSKAFGMLAKHGAMPAYLAMNPDDAIRFSQSEAYVKLADNRRVYGNEVNYRPITANGLAYVGTIGVLGVGMLPIYAYYGTYNTVSADGKTFTSANLLPQGKAILAPGAIGFKGFTGLLAEGQVQRKIAAENYTYVYPKTKGVLVDTMIQEQTAPAPILTAIDRYCVLTGIPNK